MKLHQPLVKQLRRIRKGHFHPLKGHPFIVPVFTILFLVFAGAVAYVGFNAQTVGADDSRVVKLSINGQTQIIPTRAATVGELLDRVGIEVGEQDIVEPPLDTVIIEDDFRINLYRAQPVTIFDEDGTKTQVLSAQPTPRLIAEKAGFSLAPEDRVEIVQPGEVLEDGIIGAKVVIERAQTAHLNLYGTAVEVKTHATTVRELLEEKDIQTNPGDTIQPGPETVLTPQTVVFVVSEGKRIETREETVAAPVETISDSNLAAGTTQVRQAGIDGKKLITYEIDIATGGRRALQEIVLVQPQKRIVVKGTRSVFSNFSSDGIPARVFCGSPKQRNWKNINVGNAAIGRAMAAEYGWTGGEFDALLELFACESSWNETAGNPYSGAYGIPQALPASKMASAGEDWFTNPRTQISWGLGYIKRVYGSPSVALAKHYRVNYY